MGHSLNLRNEVISIYTWQSMFSQRRAAPGGRLLPMLQKVGNVQVHVYVITTHPCNRLQPTELVLEDILGIVSCCCHLHNEASCSHSCQLMDHMRQLIHPCTINGTLCPCQQKHNLPNQNLAVHPKVSWHFWLRGRQTSALNNILKVDN